MVVNRKITAMGTEVRVILDMDDSDYICLTDMARFRDNDPTLVISHWMRNRSTIEYLGLWESINNPEFKPTEFERFKEESGYNSFTLSPKKWIETTHAIGITSRSGRYGGTYAHKDIAFSFAMWLSPAFQLYCVKELQRLKSEESNPLIEQWNVKRILSKTNYQIHTDAIKNVVIPQLSVAKQKESLVYASEADMLNIALFGCTARQWEEQNPQHVGKLNMRDLASINQLVVLSNLESANAEMMKQEIDRNERFKILSKMAKEQLETLDRCNAEHRFRKYLPLAESEQTKQQLKLRK